MSIAARAVVCLFAVSLLCSGAEGQDSSDFGGLSGLSSLLSAMTPSRGDDGELSSRSRTFVPPEFRVSGMGIRGDASFDLGDAGGILGGVLHHFEFRGASFELSQRFFFSSESGGLINATYLYPTSQTISEKLQYVFGNRHFDWSMKTQLWTVGAGAFHNIANSFTVLCGAQYVSFDLTFASITSAAGTGRMINPESSCEVRAATPYLGVFVNDNSSETHLNAGLLVCPAMLGTMEYSLAAAPASSPSKIWGRFVKSGFLVLSIEYAKTIPWG